MEVGFTTINGGQWIGLAIEAGKVDLLKFGWPIVVVLAIRNTAPTAADDFSLSRFSAVSSDCSVATKPMSCSIILARSTLDGSAMGELEDATEGGEGGGLCGGAIGLSGAATVDSASAEVDE
jgi:hypothetical protein